MNNTFPGFSEIPSRFIMKLDKVLCNVMFVDFGCALVWQNDCITKSAEKFKHV